MKIILVLMATGVLLSGSVVRVFADQSSAPGRNKSDEVPASQPNNSTQPQSEVTPSPIQSQPVSPTPSPVSQENSGNPQPTVTPVPVTNSSHDTPQIGRGPKSDATQQETKDSSPQKMEDAARESPVKPVELTMNTVPEPQSKENDDTFVTNSTPTPQKRTLSATVQPQIRSIIKAPIDFLHNAAGAAQYYKSSQLPASLTYKLLALGSLSLVLGFLLLRPRLIWGRFFGIKYFQLHKKGSTFHRLSANTFSSELPVHKEREEGLLQRLSF